MRAKKYKPAVPEHRLRDFKPRVLIAPEFEYAPVQVRTAGIAFSQTVKQVMSKGLKL